MVKETSTLAQSRPTILDEKRRMERELGLPIEPAIVFPKSNRWDAGKLTVGGRLAQWLRGASR